MATRPGEDLAATLFADVHYYYGPPTANPPHHRFDKASYVYLFENAGQRRARLEVANNAGKPHQDAFNGHLDSTHVQYSYRQTNLVTVTVDGPGARDRVSPMDGQEWHLPHFDPKNENKYMYRLHTLDLYFYTKEDALNFVSHIRRVLPSPQVTIEDEPVAPAPHADAMSPVVQKLENVAISDPSYQHGQTRDSRTTSTAFAGPPMSALPNHQEASSYSSLGQLPGPPAAPPQQPAAFVPMAYNPAAPAAPETIHHREKTPPPEDGAGNPLVAAASSDQGQMYGAGYHPQGGFSGPPTTQTPPQASYFPNVISPPASAPPQSHPAQSPYAQHFQNTFAGPPTVATNPLPGPPAYKVNPSPIVPYNQFSPHPATSPQAPTSYSPQATPSYSAPAPAPYNPAGAPPPGGFANFSYGSTGVAPLSNTPALNTDYAVHQQVYRPTESEASIKHHDKPKPAQAGIKPPAGKLEQRAGQLEKGMTGLFRKLEKRIG